MDKTGADFHYSVRTIHDRLGGNAHPIQLNIGTEDAFEGMIDLIEMKEYIFSGDKEESYETREIRESELARAKE